MNGVGSGEALKNEIERVRLKLLGKACFKPDPNECENDSPIMAKQEEICSTFDQQKTETEEETLSNVEEIKQNDDLPGAGSDEPLQVKKCDESDFETTTIDQATVGVCQVENEVSGNNGHEENDSQESLPSGHEAKMSNPEYPLTSIEVSVSGRHLCDQMDSKLTECKSTKTGIVKTIQGDAVSRRKEFFSARPIYNLSIAPISVITLKTTNSGLCTCGDMLFNKTSREKNVTQPSVKTDEKEALDSTDLDVIAQPKTNLPSELELKTRLDEIFQENEPSKGTNLGEERPAARRRLSKTIQHLQEQIQKEIESNGSKAWKEDDRPGKTSESKKASKLSNRFMRERSRKRSKSRVGYKVLQTARKCPNVGAKERPYRQWMGVGNCVGNDRRFILSSNSFKDSNRRLERENSLRKGDVKIAKKPFDVVAHEDEISMKNLGDQIESAEHKKDLSPKTLLTVGPNHSHLSDSLEARGTRNNCPSSIARERSRGFRRSSLYPDRRIRPPTPHSDSSRGNENVEKLQFDTSKHQMTSRKSLMRGALGVKTLSRVVSKTRQTLVDVGQYSSGLSDDTSPSKPDFDDIVRTSKLFTAAPRQQRKQSRTAHLLRRNTDVLQGQMEKSITSNIAMESFCVGNLTASEDSVHHGSMETLYSDVSTTTGESSTKTGSSSSWNCKDNPGSHDNTGRQHWYNVSSPDERLTRAGLDISKRVLEAREKDRVVQNRKYVEVQAVVDFKGSLPGQLSFNKGQIIRLLVSSTQGLTEDMSYGYYRTGALKRKKKGLFPSACVTPLTL